MAQPKISIVTPVFNQAPYLEQTIHSVLNQNYPNLEYIIIDGGSADGSVDIIKKYESRLSYWISEKDHGMYHALQKGFERSSGEIMAYINADDCYLSQAFSMVADIFNRFSEISWLTGHPTAMDESGRIVKVDAYRKWSKFDLLSGTEEFIQQESVFWRRELWNKAGAKIDNGFKLAGDFNLWMRFFNFSKLYSLHFPVASFRLRSKNQLSMERFKDYMAEVNTIIKENLQKLSEKERSDWNAIKRYRSFDSKIPVWRFMKFQDCQKMMNYPPEIIFDRSTQQFKLQS